MSLKRKVSELAAQKLPAKTGTSNSVGEQSGLRPRPQFEQIVDYLANGQERVKYPGREAKMIRNRPYMTQLDFFDMQIDQNKAWEEQKKKEETKQISQETQTSDTFEQTIRKRPREGNSDDNDRSKNSRVVGDDESPGSGGSSGSGGGGGGGPSPGGGSSGSGGSPGSASRWSRRQTTSRWWRWQIGNARERFHRGKTEGISRS